MLNSKLTDHSTLKPFGCLAYASPPPPPCATKSIFLEYGPHTKDFTLWNIENAKMFISRDVQFVEDQFPYPSSPTESLSGPTIFLNNPPHSDDLPISTVHHSRSLPITNTTPATTTPKASSSVASNEHSFQSSFNMAQQLCGKQYHFSSYFTSL